MTQTVPICRCGHSQRAHVSANGVCYGLVGGEPCDCVMFVLAEGEQAVML